MFVLSFQRSSFKLNSTSNISEYTSGRQWNSLCMSSRHGGSEASAGCTLAKPEPWRLAASLRTSSVEKPSQNHGCDRIRTLRTWPFMKKGTWPFMKKDHHFLRVDWIYSMSIPCLFHVYSMSIPCLFHVYSMSIPSAQGKQNPKQAVLSSRSDTKSPPSLPGGLVPHVDNLEKHKKQMMCLSGYPVVSNTLHYS